MGERWLVCWFVCCCSPLAHSPSPPTPCRSCRAILLVLSSCCITKLIDIWAMSNVSVSSLAESVDSSLLFLSACALRKPHLRAECMEYVARIALVCGEALLPATNRAQFTEDLIRGLFSLRYSITSSGIISRQLSCSSEAVLIEISSAAQEAQQQSTILPFAPRCIDLLLAEFAHKVPDYLSLVTVADCLTLFANPK